MKKSYKTALSGMLLALSAGLSAAESLIPLPLGVKPGFSNIPVMFAMYEINTGCALAICILKSFFVFLTRGTTAFIMSISGGLAAFFTMLLLSKKTKASIVLTSVAGSLMHNVGQLSAAWQLCCPCIYAGTDNFRMHRRNCNRSVSGIINAGSYKNQTKMRRK